MSKGTFQKVENTDQKMYGPLKLLVCGYQPDDQELFLSLLGQLGMGNVPVVFINHEDSEITLKDLLKRKERSGLGIASAMRRAVIISGFTQRELHRLISTYRQAGLPAQLWATLTPISETWPINKLLDELAKEAEAMARTRSQKKPV